MTKMEGESYGGAGGSGSHPNRLGDPSIHRGSHLVGLAQGVRPFLLELAGRVSGSFTRRASTSFHRRSASI